MELPIPLDIQNALLANPSEPLILTNGSQAQGVVLPLELYHQLQDVALSELSSNRDLADFYQVSRELWDIPEMDEYDNYDASRTTG